LGCEFINVFRTLARNVNPQLIHGGNRLRTYGAGFRARAFHIEAITGIMPQEPFGHLTAR
jgi:hypothetical protein